MYLVTTSLANTSMPHSTLKKKLSSITFHFVYEKVAYNELLRIYSNTHLNTLDMYTKSLLLGEKRN